MTDNVGATATTSQTLTVDNSEQASYSSAVGNTPGLLDYSIANEPATVHDVLLQKGDGTFELVVWDERPGGGTDGVTVDLGAPRAAVKVYDPTLGTSATQTLSGVGSVALTLGDHPVVVEIGR